MEQLTLPVISECVIAYDLDLGRYVTIGPSIGILAGYKEGQKITSENFWLPFIHPSDVDKVKDMYSRLSINGNIDVPYRIVPANSTDVRYVSEKRSVYHDGVSGHRILLSILNEHAAGRESAMVMAGEAAKDDTLKREQFLLSLINSQTNFLVRLDREGCFTFVNKRYCQVFGYTEEELIGKHYYINTAAEDRERCQAAFIRCLSHPGKIIPLTRSKLDKTGEKHPSEWEFVSIIDQNGDVTEIQGIGQDISHRIRIEEQMNNTREKLDNFIESVTDAFFITDTDWRFIKVNAAFEKLVNRERCELIGEVIWDMFPRLEGSGFAAAYRNAADKRTTEQFTGSYQNLTLHATAYPSAEGLTVFINDITAQVKIEQQLNSVRNNLVSLINNTDDLVWAIDLNGKYIYTNNAYKSIIEKVTGSAPVDGRPLDGKLDNEVFEEWNAYYKRAFSGERFSIVSKSMDESGKEAYQEVTFNPILNDTGDIAGVGCFARDITQRLQYENEIIHQNERLRHIASLSSHELRRPVASMLGLINLVDYNNFNNPDNKETICYLREVGKEIDEVIRQIVDNAFTKREI